MTGMDGDEELLELFRAIARRDSEAVSRLLAADPQLFTASSQRAEELLTEIPHQVYAGDTALHIAAAAFWPSLTFQLLEGGAQVAATNRRGAQPLHYAVDGIPGSPSWDPTSQVKVISSLLTYGADPNAQDKNGTTPLHRAVRNRCSAAVGRLLEAGADPDIRNGRGSTVRELARWPTGRGGSGLPEAKAEQEKILELLRP
jgi:ankyrin repeat protein